MQPVQGQEPTSTTDAAGRHVWTIGSRSFFAISGADDAPTETTAPAAPIAPAPAPVADQTFDRAYVEELRSEAAKHRTRANAAESELTKVKQAQESEAEKTIRERNEATERAAKAETALKGERTTNAIYAAASKLGLVPDLAVRLMATETVEFDDAGKPTKVDAALEKLVKQYPQLVVSGGNSSATNGARGSLAEVPETDAQRRARLNGGGNSPFAPSAARR